MSPEVTLLGAHLLTWCDITGRIARWESHRSLDGGATWTPHWVVDFARRPAGQ